MPRWDTVSKCHPSYNSTSVLASTCLIHDKWEEIKARQSYFLFVAEFTEGFWWLNPSSKAFGGECNLCFFFFLMLVSSTFSVGAVAGMRGSGLRG